MTEQYENQKEVGQLLFQMAWADGQIQQAEVDLIASFLKTLGLPLAERVCLIDNLMAKPSSKAGEANEVSLSLSRPTLMELLVRVCFADTEAGPNEIAMLGELAVRWGISAEQLEQFRLKAVEGVS